MPLSIALTADPELPVPPKFYGGIERIIDMLAHGLHERGHEVTLFAHPGSRTAGKLVAWPGADSRSVMDTARNSACLADEVVRSRFDIVHSFSRVAYLTPVLPLTVPKLMTYQRAISRSAVRLGHTLSRGTLEFTAISRWMMRPVENVGSWHMVPNGVPLDAYQFQVSVATDAPLVFLGRVEEIKGPHLAIEIARRTGLPLVIAGNIPVEKQSWFETEIAPHLDGTHIRYTGPVDDAQKNQLLGSARAFLMPILWDEPFGIVMAEAMACGTPVIGLRRGAVPEVVQDGVTGFLCDDLNELVAAVGRIDELDRSACRRRVENMYSADVVTDRYLEVYASRCAGRARTPRSSRQS